MYLKDILFEDFVNYKDACMFIICGTCNFKCVVEQGLPPTTCQNYELNKVKDIYVSDDAIIKQYMNNPITHAIVFGGLEPITRIDDIVTFIDKLREKGCTDTVVIYSGFYPEEIYDELDRLTEFDNIIVKFGRYVPDYPSRYDDVLGITLASNNQYAEKIS